MGGNTREVGRTSASRLLAILGAFTVNEPTLSLTKLADRAGLPLTTAHRLVGELVEWGALERTANGQLQIGMRLWHTGALAPGHRNLRSMAMRFMEELYDATHEVAQLVVRDGTEATVLEKIAGRNSVLHVAEVAGRLPLHATAVGKVILAYSEPDLLAAVVTAGLPRETPHTIVLPGVLAENLCQVRETGLGFSNEEMRLGTNGIAAPVFGPDGRLLAAIGLVVRSSASVRPLTMVVRAAGLGLTRRLTLQQS